jgi:predicted NAD/FAD-binding protein
MQKVAVVGTGIAGMAAAHRVFPHVDLTVIEACPEPGGHTHTVDVSENGRNVPIDTGFMVYNEVTYPLLTQLFKDLDVPTMETDMSFSVQHRPSSLEWCGSGLKGVFAQPTNVLRPRFLRMLIDLLRFNRQAVALLDKEEALELSLQRFIEKHRFSKAFLNTYLVPMTSAIWSTPPDEMLNFPAHTLIRFMHNHGLLGVRTQHQWRTVVGGSRTYRDKLIRPFKDRIRCNCPARSVKPTSRGVTLTFADGNSEHFDKVILATHADTSLQLIETPTHQQQRLLSAFPYAKNPIKLHSDASVMPRSKAAWASWNYRVDALADGRTQASTHYWMNRLQKVSDNTAYFVSVNDPDLVRPETVHREFTFDHPMFSTKSLNAQFELPTLNENQKLYFCGSYFRYGFHEDGLMSGTFAGNRLLSHLDAYAELPV